LFMLQVRAAQSALNILRRLIGLLGLLKLEDFHLHPNKLSVELVSLWMIFRNNSLSN
jgi:hypothetical protein